MAGNEDPGLGPHGTTTLAGAKQLVTLPSGASLKYSAAARNLSGYESVQELECCSIREEKALDLPKPVQGGDLLWPAYKSHKSSDHQQRAACCLPMTTVTSQAVGPARTRGLCICPRGYSTISGLNCSIPAKLKEFGTVLPASRLDRPPCGCQVGRLTLQMLFLFVIILEQECWQK